MANTTSLLRKGLPPVREKAALSVIETDPRQDDGRKQPLQVKVPTDVYEAFSRRAGEEFGFTGGAKTKLFLAMWEKYTAGR